jgi:L-lactate dehydrogenase complex protein LldG
VSAATTSPQRAASFTERAASVGTQVHSATRAEAADVILRLLAAEPARVVALDAAGHAGLPALAAALAAAGIAVLPPDAPVDALARAEGGVSVAAFAVAETGSVALAAAAPTDRLVSMLPSLHIAIARHSQIVPDLDAAAERLRAWTTPPIAQPYVSLVTGASRTSDIERVLTIGVHGPRVHHVVLLTDE